MPPEGRSLFSLVSQADDLAGQSGWYLLCGELEQLAQIADDFMVESEMQGVPCTRINVDPVESLAARLTDAPTPLVVLVVPPSDAVSLGHLLESARSQLPLRKQVAMVLTQDSAGELQQVAPHFASFIEEIEVIAMDVMPELTSDEIEGRLIALRASKGLNDEQVINLAEQGTLPPDPEFAEWLVMVGRGDLVR